MYWLVTGSSITECQSRAEAQELLLDVLAMRRGEGCEIWPPFRIYGYEDVYLVTWRTSPRTEHIYVTSIRPRGNVKDGESYDG